MFLLLPHISQWCTGRKGAQLRHQAASHRCCLRERRTRLGVRVCDTPPVALRAVAVFVVVVIRPLFWHPGTVIMLAGLRLWRGARRLSDLTSCPVPTGRWVRSSLPDVVVGCFGNALALRLFRQVILSLQVSGPQSVSASRRTLWSSNRDVKDDLERTRCDSMDQWQETSQFGHVPDGKLLKCERPGTFQVASRGLASKLNDNFFGT